MIMTAGRLRSLGCTAGESARGRSRCGGRRVRASDEVLSRRALNRALLDRQMLLRRVPSPRPGAQGGPDAGGAPGGSCAAGGAGEWVCGGVEGRGGMRARARSPPYYGLWSRLDGFQPDHLADLIVSRQVVRIALMRGTIHLVSAAECLTVRP